MDQTALQVVEVYSFIGLIAAAVMFFVSVDRAQKAPKAAAVLPVRSEFAWVHCPNGHCKVFANRDWSCPSCGAQLRQEDDNRALWAAMEAA